MEKIKISDAEIVVYALQDEIRRSHEARYDHRLHAVLLVAQGLSCRKVAQLLGDSPRAVAYWARRFENEGLAGLAEAERPGRPRRLMASADGTTRPARGISGQTHSRRGVFRY